MSRYNIYKKKKSIAIYEDNELLIDSEDYQKDPIIIKVLNMIIHYICLLKKLIND